MNTTVMWSNLNWDLLSYGLLAVAGVLVFQFIILSWVVILRVQKEVYRFLIVVPMACVTIAGVAAVLVIPISYYF